MLKSRLVKIFGSVAAVVVIALWLQSWSHEIRPLPVSLVQLIATPEQYDGDFVAVAGVLHARFEDYALYLSREHAEYGLSGYAIWISACESQGAGGKWKEDNSKLDALMQRSDRKYVLVQGTFDADKHGHLNLFRGEIEDVARLVVLEKWPEAGSDALER